LPFFVEIVGKHHRFGGACRRKKESSSPSLVLYCGFIIPWEKVGDRIRARERTPVVFTL